MKIIDYKCRYDGRINLALGYFDSLHLGHQDLINACAGGGAEIAVFTFSNNAFKVLGIDQLQVFTMNERAQRMQELGVELVIKAVFDNAMMNMSGEKFLAELLSTYNIKKIIIGSDYRCGAGASCDAYFVKKYMTARNVAVDVIELRSVGGKKISSGRIRELIRNGDVATANTLLPMPYFINGSVKLGRGEGSKKLGFPTANIEFADDKLPLRDGVYATCVAFGGSEYRAITNVGAHPTFNDFHYNVESFILDFDGNIYNEDITVYFITRMRDTVKFNSFTELTEQIARDVEIVRKSL